MRQEPPDFLDISPTEFELTVLEFLKDLGSRLENFQITHNSIETSHDGNYQIDIKATFEALGIKMAIIVECKKHNSPIKREVVQILKDKLQTLGAQKGILFSTAKFQSGCIEYAEKHGLALVRLIDGKFTYEVKSMDKENIWYPPDLPKYVGEYIYNITDTGYTTYNLSPGYTDGLLEYLQK
ncbi:MAG: restriction endonuclease [Chitinophagales bacterium]|nr:restriction endonuclease [Chitinophagales bacterium]